MRCDFSRPGEDGRLPGGFQEFRRGLIYTVRPRMLDAPVCGERYRILVSTKRRIPAGEPWESYAPCYRRAAALLGARVEELRATSAAPLNTFTVAEGWFRLETPEGPIASAAITVDVLSGQDVGAVCDRDEPSDEALRAPFVEQLEAGVYERGPGWDEWYNEFDLLPSDRSIVSLSYGEYVSPSAVLDFEPIVRRAEQRAHFQHESLEEHDRAGAFRIIRRAWQCLETGKPSQPLLAHVDIYFGGRAATLPRLPRDAAGTPASVD